MLKKLNKLSVIFCVFVMLIISGFALTACDGSVIEQNNNEEHAQNLSIVYANRNLSSAKPLQSVISPYLLATLKSDGEISYVRCDSKPKQVDYDKSQFVQSKKANEQNKDRENQGMINKFFDFIISEESDAQNSEVDIVSAITTAAKTLPVNKEEGKENNIIIIDSGISTSGRINFREADILNLENRNYNNLPELKHIDNIIWCGFNNTCGNQNIIPSDYNLYEKSQKLYNDFFRSAGVRNDIKWLANSAGDNSGDKSNLPDVSVVEFIE